MRFGERGEWVWWEGDEGTAVAALDCTVSVLSMSPLRLLWLESGVDNGLSADASRRAE